METIIKEYESKSFLLEEFKKKAESLLRDLLVANSLRYHQISSRLKTGDSLSKKILRKQGYSSLDDITDIIGCRIITYFEDEVDRIADIIESEFIIDLENSIDKRKIEFDRFGYLSLHFVVEFNKTRLKLTEYKKFEGIKFEIQIRSILQHSWAEIEHDIGYKGNYSIPDVVRRRFSRIAALLETADLEFVRLRNELHEYENTVSQEIKKNPETVTLNQASLLSFVKNNLDLISVDKVIADHLNLKLSENTKFTEEAITLLEFGGIKTIEQLGNLYKTKSKCIISFSKNWRIRDTLRKKEKMGGINGISIYDTGYYLISKSKNENDIIEFLKQKYKGKEHSYILEQTTRCLEAFNKLEPSCR